MEQFLSEAFPDVQLGLAIPMCIVAILIVIVSIIALIVSIYLAISYIKYNRKQNSIGMTGLDIARKILDDNGLSNIKVSATGSLLFGNSYSHYFKKVRLRRLTYKKTSVSSMVMATQKSALAILDKENDPDMRKRVRLTPIISFGPFAFIPIIIIGALLDFLVFSGDGTVTLIATGAGVLIYLFAFLMSLSVLKTEKKAQARAIEIMQSENIATSEEQQMAQKLFKLYNIEYVNNMVLAMLELIYYILQFVAAISGNSTSD